MFQICQKPSLGFSIGPPVTAGVYDLVEHP